MAHAHLYARISDPAQRKGGGLERQTTADVKAFCTLHAFDLGKKVYVDDGVSAWKGLNATPQHQLGQFMADVRRGIVPAGDCLLIENWDRLTRQDVWAATGLVNDLRQMGIHVGTLDRMKLLRCDSDDVGDFFETAIELMRGNSESKMKSIRNSAKWERRREKARNGGVLTRKLPAWVEERDGKLHLIPDRAETVRRIFEMSGAGHGTFSIMRRLVENGVPAFGERKVKEGKGRSAFSGKWSASYLHIILKDRRAVGEFQPRKGGRPDGDPIPDYFPRVVSDEAWERARRGAEGRHRKGVRDGSAVNVFAGLLRDARTGEAYLVATEMGHAGRPNYKVLRSAVTRTEGRGGHSFPLDVFERCVLGALAEIDPRDVMGRDDAPDEVLTISGELARVDGRIADLEAELVEGDVPAIARALRSLEARRKELADRLTDARRAAAHPLSEAWGEAHTLLEAVAAAPDPRDARLRLRTALRRVVTGIRVYVFTAGKRRGALVRVHFASGLFRPGLPDLVRTYLIARAPARSVGFGKGRRDVPARDYWWTCLEHGFTEPYLISIAEDLLASVDLDAPQESHALDLSAVVAAHPPRPEDLTSFGVEPVPDPGSPEPPPGAKVRSRRIDATGRPVA